MGFARIPRFAATGEAILGPGGNSIGFLRYVLAALVVVHHAFVLNGLPDPSTAWTKGQFDLGIVAVTGFFVLSGFLIARSADRTRPLRYLWHRLLRIMPAFWVCLIVSALVFAPTFWIVEHGSLAGFRSIEHRPPLGYVIANAGLFINQTAIDGMLSTNPYRSAINGSLWTLSYEFVWYLITGALAIAGVLGRPRLAVAVIAVLIGLHFAGDSNPLSSVPVVGYGIASRFGPAFGLGIRAYLWRAKVPRADRLAVVAAAAMVVGVVSRTVPFVSVPALAYLLLWAAWRLPVRQFDSRWDLSYGLYIYAFPVQQGLALLGSPQLPVPVSAALALAIASGLALISYVVVERPALRLKHWTPRFGRAVTTARPAFVGEAAVAEPALLPDA